MRWSLLAVCLLIPAASAQVFDAGDLGVEHSRAPPSLFPFQAGGLSLDMEYVCAPTDTELDTLRVHVNATATRRSDGAAVPVDEPGVQVIDLERCRAPGARSFGFDVDVAWTMGAILVEDVLDIDVTVWAEAGEGSTYRATDTVRASKSIAMYPEPVDDAAMAEEMSVVASAQTQDQLAPGPALPLLAVGLLALARRR